jgi:hypothetical protein
MTSSDNNTAAIVQQTATPLPRFRRSSQAPRCLLQDRDLALLEDLWRYRALTTSQLEQLRVSDPNPDLRFVSRLTLTRRLKLLFHGKYVRRLARPSITGMQEPVYLLDSEGAKSLSLKHGEVTVRAPSQMPKLAALEHILSINQFRVSLTATCAANPLEILGWQTSDEAKFRVAARKVTLIPDAGFTVKTANLKLFYFLEVDLGSEPSRILTEKCQSYYAFWQSGEFAQKYFCTPNVGFRVLFVAPTEKRAATILKSIQKLDAGQNMFWVTGQEDITPERILEPIWSNTKQENHKARLTGN